jgi:hypothetical protein
MRYPPERAVTPDDPELILHDMTPAQKKLDAAAIQPVVRMDEAFEKLETQSFRTVKVKKQSQALRPNKRLCRENKAPNAKSGVGLQGAVNFT